jgi:hypothetical protein
MDDPNARVCRRKSISDFAGVIADAIIYDYYFKLGL